MKNFEIFIIIIIINISFIISVVFVLVFIIEITHNIQFLHIGVTLEYQVTTSILRLQEPSSKFLLFPVALISGFAMPLQEFQFPSNCLLNELVSFPTLQLQLE